MFILKRQVVSAVVLSGLSIALLLAFTSSPSALSTRERLANAPRVERTVTTSDGRVVTVTVPELYSPSLSDEALVEFVETTPNVEDGGRLNLLYDSSWDQPSPVD